MGRRLRVAPRLLGGVGLIVLVIGTFLPWLRSGDSVRNSYAALGVVRDLVGASSLIGALAGAWPYVGLACAVAIALGAVGPELAAGVLGLVIAGVAATVSILALQVPRQGDVSVPGSGPGVTLFGAAFVAIAAILLASAVIRRRVRQWRATSR